jgi:integrase
VGREAEKAAKRAAEARSVTFRDAALAYVNSPARTWKNGKSRQQWVASLGLDDKAKRRKTRVTYLPDDFLDTPVESITVADVRRVVATAWYRRTETAARVLGRIRAIIDAARADDESRWSNPALLARHRHVLAKKSEVKPTVPQPSLPHQHVAEFMAKLAQMDTEPARALALLALAAVRSGVVLGARWSEFDLAEGIWTVPVARTGMKGRKRPLRIPLSDAALAVLKKASEVVLDDRVFHCSENAMTELMAELKLPSDVEGRHAVPHGLRSTFKNWAIEATGYPDFLSEMALGHASGDKVRSAYARSDLFDMRRELMDAWGTFCTTTKGKAKPCLLVA